MSVAKIVWQNGLKDLRDVEIAAGIKALADWMPLNSEDRVPTVTEFKNLICPRIPEQKRITADDSKPYVPAKQETYQKNMREILNKIKSNCSNKSQQALNNIDKRIEQEPYFVKR